MFKWLSAKNSEAFGIELAGLVKELAPNDLSLSESKRQSKLNFAKEKMLKRIKQFRQDEILNFYKIARLLNSFKWDLQEVGYDPKLTDSLSAWVLINLRSR
jgi:hypothetical protein